MPAGVKLGFSRLGQRTLGIKPTLHSIIPTYPGENLIPISFRGLL